MRPGLLLPAVSSSLDVLKQLPKTKWDFFFFLYRVWRAERLADTDSARRMKEDPREVPSEVGTSKYKCQALLLKTFPALISDQRGVCFDTLLVLRNKYQYM